MKVVKRYKFLLLLPTQLCPTLCDLIACQAPLSMKFSQKEYWSGVSFTLPGGSSQPRVEPTSLTSPVVIRYICTRDVTLQHHKDN